jgi:hypothetical protein
MWQASRAVRYVRTPHRPATITTLTSRLGAAAMPQGRLYIAFQSAADTFLRPDSDTPFATPP